MIQDINPGSALLCGILVLFICLGILKEDMVKKILRSIIISEPSLTTTARSSWCQDSQEFTQDSFDIPQDSFDIPQDSVDITQDSVDITQDSSTTFSNLPNQFSRFNKMIYKTSGNNANNSNNSKHTKRRVLIVGINYENSPAELRGCINDARNMEKVLTKLFGFNEVLVITDDTEQKPTRENMILAMKWLVHNVSPGDVLYMHYSGHGSYVFDTTGDEIDRQDETIVPVDYQWTSEILDDDLFDLLVKPLQDKEVLLTASFDCCHSGSGIDLRYRYIVDKSGKSIRKQKGQSSRSCSANVRFISGCADMQTSSDVSAYGGTAYGAFTKAYIEALEKSKTVEMTYQNFILRINQTLDKGSFTQQPQIGTATDIDMHSRFSITSITTDVTNSRSSGTNDQQQHQQQPLYIRDDLGNLRRVNQRKIRHSIRRLPFMLPPRHRRIKDNQKFA